VAAEFSINVVAIPDAILFAADWTGPGDWFPEAVNTKPSVSVPRMRINIYVLQQLTQNIIKIQYKFK
jgi:hypothetical protein